MRSYHIEVTVLTRSGTNKFKRQKEIASLPTKKCLQFSCFYPGMLLWASVTRVKWGHHVKPT